MQTVCKSDDVLKNKIDWRRCLDEAVYCMQFQKDRINPAPVFNALAGCIESDMECAVRYHNKINEPYYGKLEIFMSKAPEKSDNGTFLVRLASLNTTLLEEKIYQEIIIHTVYGDIELTIDNWRALRPQGSISLLSSGVLDVRADIIVNAADSVYSGGGGVDLAIHRAAGPLLRKACDKLDYCPTGEVRLTPAFGITQARYIVHAVGPIYDEDPDPSLLASCYTNALDLAVKHDCISIAFPSISTGVFGYPVSEAADIASSAIMEWQSEHAGNRLNVYLCCYRPQELSAYLECGL